MKKMNRTIYWVSVPQTIYLGISISYIQFSMAWASCSLYIGSTERNLFIHPSNWSFSVSSEIKPISMTTWWRYYEVINLDEYESPLLYMVDFWEISIVSGDPLFFRSRVRNVFHFGQSLKIITGAVVYNDALHFKRYQYHVFDISSQFAGELDPWSLSYQCLRVCLDVSRFCRHDKLLYGGCGWEVIARN